MLSKIHFIPLLRCHNSIVEELQQRMCGLLQEKHANPYKSGASQTIFGERPDLSVFDLLRLLLSQNKTLTKYKPKCSPI